MIEHYTQLKTPSSIAKDLLEYANNSQNWQDVAGMVLTLVPEELVRKDATLSELIDRFDCGGKLSILRTEPNVFYQWHTDIYRYCALNMQLSGWDSISMFGKRKPPHWYVDIDRLNYEAEKYYLFNVLKPHSVINFGEVRYVFSIGFHTPTRYEEVREFLLEKNL